MGKNVSLTNEQYEAINETERNLQIIACAGSGKTEVITRRIANILKSKPEIKPNNIVAFTFTEKAAESMKSRIMKALDLEENAIESMYVGTIHGFCYDLLRNYAKQFEEYKILDTVKSHLFVERYYKECGMSDLGLEENPRNINLFLQCIDKMIDDYENADQWEELHRKSFDNYVECLYKHGFIDFSLLIFETVKQIHENAKVSEYLSGIKYLVVDEYQDVDDLQEKLISLIAGKGANVCVVGDDDQTIYQFRGSNAGNMISFAERYPDVHQVYMEKNFRCVPGVVDVADCVIKNNDNRLAKKMVSAGSIENTEIKAIRYDSSIDQYDGIADKILSLHESGIPYKEIAILVRKGKYINPISKSLEKKMIPYETDSAEKFFTGIYFEKFVNTLNILLDVDKSKVYECWKDLVDGTQINMGFRYLRSCTRSGKIYLGDIIRNFCEKIDFLNADAEDLEERKNDLDGIVKILNDYDEIYGDRQISYRINKVTRFLATRVMEEYKYHKFTVKKLEDAVQIMTVHKSKGLEFDTVFLPELEKREFPASNIGGKKYWHVLGDIFEEKKDKYASDIEDERKLFYVAVTRAKRNLYFTYQLSEQPVSVFVKEAAVSEYIDIDLDDLSYNPNMKDDEMKEYDSN